MTYNSFDNSPTKDTLLAIETSSTVCSLALYSEQGLIAECNLYKKNTHAEIITRSIEHLLTSSKLDFNNLLAIAITKGPGSYTGLRIGASIAKGLCFALKIPLISVDTLKAMAYGMQAYYTTPLLLCPMIDARRMEVYTLLSNTNLEILLPSCPMVIDNNSFSEWLMQNEIIFFGDGAQKCIPYLGKHKNAKFIDNIYPNAIHIAELSYKKLKQNAIEDLASYTPIYLKEFGEK